MLSSASVALDRGLGAVYLSRKSGDSNQYSITAFKVSRSRDASALSFHLELYKEVFTSKY